MGKKEWIQSVQNSIRRDVNETLTKGLSQIWQRAPQQESLHPKAKLRSINSQSFKPSRQLVGVRIAIYDLKDNATSGFLQRTCFSCEHSASTQRRNCMQHRHTKHRDRWKDEKSTVERWIASFWLKRKAFGVVPEGTNFGVKSSVLNNMLDSLSIETKNPNKELIPKSQIAKQIEKGTYYLSCWMDMAQIERLRATKVMFENIK